MAFVVLALFVLLRVYQLFFKHRELKRERLRANYAGQAVLAFLLTGAALVLCEPRVVGLPPDIFGFGPQADESGVANVLSVSRGPKKPPINWGGPLAGVEADIDKGDWSAAAQKLFEPRRNGNKEALIVCSWDPYTAPLARAYASLSHAAFDKGDRLRAKLYMAASVDLVADGENFLFKASLADPEEWKGALADLEAAGRRAKPGDTRAAEQRLTIRLAHLADGEARGALSDVDTILAAHSSDVALLVQRAKLRRLLNALDGSIADLESATRARPTDVNNRMLLAEVRLQRNSDQDLKLAAADLDRVLREIKESEAPRDAFRAHLLRAEARLGLHMASDSLADASKATQLDPKSADAFYFLGRAEIDLDKVSGAKKDLEQAARLDTKHRRAILWHGILVYEKDPHQGLADFNRALELEPDGWAQYYKGECLRMLHRLDEAETALTEAQVLSHDEKLTRLARESYAKVQAAKKH